jgi:hypothetical protein
VAERISQIGATAKAAAVLEQQRRTSAEGKAVTQRPAAGRVFRDAPAKNYPTRAALTSL